MARRARCRLGGRGLLARHRARSGLPLIEMKPSFSVTVSVGSPISRFTKVVPPSRAPHRAAVAGALKTTISPRRGDSKSYWRRSAITRSSNEAKQPGPGVAQCSVGSMDADGMRYGFATFASKIRMNKHAAIRVTTQSIVFRHRGESRASWPFGCTDKRISERAPLKSALPFSILGPLSGRVRTGV